MTKKLQGHTLDKIEAFAKVKLCIKHTEEFQRGFIEKIRTRRENV